jgi:cell division protein FtsQ
VTSRHTNRRRPSLASRAWRILQPTLAVCAAVGAGVVAFRMAREGQYLVVKQVVVQGNRAAPAEEITAYAAVPEGVGLYDVDVEAVRRAVSEHPLVARATVRRVPPDQVLIEVSEYEAVATVALGNGLYLLDREGRAFRRAQPGEGLDLPVVTGVPRAMFSDAPEQATALVRLALGAMEAHHRAGRPPEELTEVRVDEAAGVTLRLGEPGVEVVVGRTGLDGKLARLKVVEAELRARKEQASQVFMDNDRHPERVAVRLRAPLLAQVPQGGAGKLATTRRP